MIEVNGKKMACVPCIRGHRSTKCNHAGDRILMEVRKPGRPLSNCPCRPGQPCACGAVKVAIPKKKKCGTCPPDGQKPPASASREHSPIQSTLSRTVNADSYRVTKTGTPASRHGQKAAFDPSKFLRANPSILSMASPGGMMAPMVPNGIAVSQPLNLPGYGAPVTVPNMPVSTQFDMGYRPHFPLNMPMPAAYPANGHVPLHIKMENGSPPPYPGDSFLGLASPMLPSAYPDHPNLGVGSPMLPSPYTDDSNLGVGSPVFPPPQQHSLASRHSRSSSGSAPDYLAGLGTPSMPHSPPITGPAKGSCCGGVAEPNNAIPAHLPQYTKPAIPHYEPQGVTQHHNTPVTMGMSNGFTYPAQYGSWNMPLNPQMWQQLASGYQPSMPAPPMQAAPNNIMPDLGVSQHCTCGPDCQCLGCVVHPFNNQTYRYVNSALGVSSINGHSNHSSPVTNGINGYSNPSSPVTNGVNGVSGVNGHSQINGDAVNGSPASPAPKPGSCCAPAATTVQTPTISPESPKQVPESSSEARTTSSDEASDLGEVQHTVSEIEFLWLDMPQEPCYGNHNSRQNIIKNSHHALRALPPPAPVPLPPPPPRRPPDPQDHPLPLPLRDQRTHSTRDRHSHSHHHHSKDHRHRHDRDSKPPRDRTKTTTTTTPTTLPSNARPLSRADLPAFEPLFAHYLDLQKGLDIATLDAAELKGRWKSFVGKWNRAELAAGWYDPETFERVRGEYVPAAPRVAVPAPAPAEPDRPVEEDEEDEDDYGPSLPSFRGNGSGSAPGPVIPTLSDLTLRAEQAAADRDASFADLRAARKEDRKQQKERLDDLVPRAEAGTRERMLEKRREVGDKMRAFRERSPGGGDEVGDEELVGGGDEIKRMLEREKVKVSERQLRREAVAREVAAEREERVKAYREREEETMGKLRELARRRFG